MATRSEAALIREAGSCQYSVFTMSQAMAAGMDPKTVQRRVERGDWLRMHRGVYLPSTVPVGWQQKVMAAWLACGGPDPQTAVCSHASAAAIWGFVSDVATPHVTVTGRTSRRRSGIVVHRSCRLESVGRQGFRVTSPMRTLVDLASTEPEDVVEQYLDDAHRRGLVHPQRLEEYLTREPHLARSGSRRLRKLTSFRTSAPRGIGSELETVLFRLLRRHGLPLPVPQFPVRTRNGLRYVDFAYPEELVAIEVDGYTYHAGRRAFEDDRARANELKERGFQVLQFTWAGIQKRPLDVVLQVGTAIGLEPARWRSPTGQRAVGRPG